MTAPGGAWASAHVDVELDWGNLDEELIRRLERSAQIAQRAVNKHLDKIATNAERTFDKVERGFDSQMRAMERRSDVAARQVNKNLGKIRDRDITLNVDVDDTQAVGQVRGAHRAMQAWASANPIEFGVSVDHRGARSALGGILGTLQRETSRRQVKVDIDVDRRGLGRAALGSIGSMLGTVGGKALTGAKFLGKWAGILGSATIAAGSLVPVIGALGSGLVAIGGAAGTVAVGGLFALGAAGAAVMVAFNGMGDAIKSALDPEASPEDFAKAIEGLSPAAQSVARSVRGLGQAWEEAGVKAAVQEAMFAGLGPKIAGLGRLIVPLRESLRTVAEGFNDGANGALRMINSASGMSMVKSLLADAGNMGANLGAAVTASIPGFLSLGSAASSVISPLTDGIGAMAQRWSESMLRMQQDGTLQAKMQGLLDTARQVGAALMKVGEIVGGVFRAAAAAGNGNPLGNIMGTLTAVSDWVNGPGQAALTSFFTSVGQVTSTLAPILLQVAGIIGGQVAPMIAQLVTMIGPVVGEIVTQLGYGVAALQPAIAPLGAALSQIGAALAPVLPILGQLIAQFVQLAGPILGALAQALSPILQAVGQALIAAFQALMPAIAPISNLFATLAPIIAQIATVLGQVLASAITALMPLFQTWLDVMSQLFAALSPIIPVIGEALVSAISAVAPFIQQLATMLGDALGAAIQTIAPLIPQIASAFMQILDAVMPLVPILLQLVLTCLQPIIGLLPTLMSVIASLVPVLVQLASMFASLVSAVMPVVAIIAKVIGFFVQLLGTIINFAAQALATIIGWVAGIIAGFLNMVTTVVSTVSGWVGNILGFFGDLVSRAISFVTDMWQRVTTGFSDGVSKAVDFVKELPGKIMGAFADAGKWLWDAGKKIIGGLIDGIKSMLSSLGNAIVSIFPSIIQGPVRRVLGLALGGLVPGLAAGGILDALGGGEVTGATTTIRPGGFIVNAAATRKNKGLLKQLSPRGRVLSGPGTGTSDSITGRYNGRAVARVSKGEWYAPPQDAAQILPLLMAVNAGKKTVALARAAGGLMPAFAPGGMIPTELRDRARQAVQSGYVWGGWGNGWNTDCSGLTSSLANMATGRASGPGEGERTATGGMRAFLEARNFQDGAIPGALQVGWSDTHSAATLPTGENIEHTGPEGAPASFGADAKGADSLPNVMSLPMGGDTDSGALGGGLTPGSTGGGGGSTPIGSGIGSGSGGGASWGNSGGSSKANSAADAERIGLTPVWVENWPAQIGGGGGTGGLSVGDTTPNAGVAPAATPPAPKLTASSSKKDVAAAIYAKARDRGYSHEEALAIVSTAIQESNLDANASGGGGAWHGYFQQDESYPDRDDPEGNVNGFLDRLDEKTKADPNSDIWKRIFWLQQRPGESSAEAAYGNGRQAYLSEIQSRQGEAKDLVGQVPVTPQGTVPVTVTDDQTTAPQTPPPATTTPPADAGLSPGGTPAADKPLSESMPYGKARADQYLREQNLGPALQDIGVAGLKETFGEFGDLIGVKPYVEQGIDQAVAYLKQIAERKPAPSTVKLADTVNNYGDPQETKQKTTAGMTAVMDTYRGD
ncbi:hypothetical protein ACK8HH_17090 [Gordonia sp. LUNF6]|uniref:phage tail protein n=1 Tax=Gordonia sp. LUNF6 TaxID=3388658 RepID=UPI00399ABDB1